MHELAEKVGVNQNTVAKSYRDLEVMGVIHTRRGMGVFVNKGTEAKCREDSRTRIISRLHEVVCEAKAAGMTARETKDACEKSYASDAGPYAETPKSVLSLAQTKKR
jgi:DNA-binding transcriptional regulator YhcF (GntR family)